MRPLSNLVRSEAKRFEQTILPHQASAYNLARWLARDEHDAEDIVQEALVRALRHFGTYRGESPRAWLLRIVRNTCYTWLKQHRAGAWEALDESVQSETHTESAEAVVLRKFETEMLRRAIEQLPIEFREVILLREMEGLSYKEIASIAEIPIGTVMSRLGRARERIARQISEASSDGRVGQ